MKIFVFDTETTGFINKKDPSLDAQPYIIQFAGILGEMRDGEFHELQVINQLIKPKISIPFQSSQINHIYDIDVKDAPSIDEYIDDFLALINEADAIVGHNIEFDQDMLLIELDRLGKRYLYNPRQIICTMKETVDFCQIKGNGERFKYPKLGELYKKLFGEYFLGAHDALVDVEATLRVFLELYKQQIVTPQKSVNQLMSLF